MAEHPWIFVVLIILLALGLIWPRKKRSHDGQARKQKRENLP